MFYPITKVKVNDPDYYYHLVLNFLCVREGYYGLYGITESLVKNLVKFPLDDRHKDLSRTSKFPRIFIKGELFRVCYNHFFQDKRPILRRPIFIFYTTGSVDFPTKERA